MIVARVIGLLICAHLCESVASAATFSPPPADIAPSPQTALMTAAVRNAIAPRPATNGQVMLLWTAGEAAQTVVNLSNQTATAVGMADIATITGLLVGSTNTFQIGSTNQIDYLKLLTYGQDAVFTNSSLVATSKLVTAVATRVTNRIELIGSIQLYSVPLVPGRNNWLLTSSNLVTWTRSRNLGTNAGNFTFAVTNSSHPQQFFQTLAE